MSRPRAESVSHSFDANLTGRVLVVDDHARARESIADVLRAAGHDVECCASAAEALRVLIDDSFDVVLTDLRMPGMTGLEFLRALHERGSEAQLAMVTAHASVATAVEAMRYGAFDYLEKPLQADHLEQLVARALRHGTNLDRRTAVPPTLGTTPAGPAMTVAMIGSSPLMQSLRSRIARVSPTDETVLITGESGTGKELVARSVHAASRRANQAMVSLNCPVLSAQLMESELFGHERGAFTSADAPRVGRFQLADRGTILLDEITEIDLPLQAKLLRVLQERSFERVGASETIRVDVRVVATTNRDLQREVAQGTFREDLYFRLAVVPLAVPPLRERREDVLELIDHFCRRSAQRLVKSPCTLDKSAADLLVNYRWPGNVRELENLITRASVLSLTGKLTADELRPWLIDAEGASETDDSAVASDAVPVGLSLQEMERRMIEATLDHYSGHRQKTADALGIGVRTLSSKLRSYGVAPRGRTVARAA